ncbi:response regulator transcription factor [Planctomonas sp. JC2975]|uniref:response regulator n=1 Tax=Planctomonas sp. JC2975 TaxID=2729626 RepID=UPI001474EE60|nr:response regulator [Planctomonas sp. JC2975]NNC12949.1 response regulator transcription factor [Planctomonas sp. JC2975]
MPPRDGRTPVRVGILDDHELLLDSLSNWIRDHEPLFDLVVAAPTWVELVHSAAFPTDLVLMDLNLSEKVSIEARVRTCRAAGASVIVLTALDTPEERERCLGAGALAFLSKAQPVREVMTVAKSVMGLTDAGPSASGSAAAGRAAAKPKLSDGERIAFLLYVDGNSTLQVADEMHVQFETAKTYLRRVREKYGRAGRPTSTRADLIRRAAEDGYLT